jgi:hypothetical protein
MARPPPLPRARAFLSFGPLAGLLTREAARVLPSPALADTPAPPASSSRSRVFPLWQTGPTGQPRRLPRVRRSAVPSPPSPPSPCPRHTGRVWHRPVLPPLTNVLARYRPTVESHRRRCAPHRRPPSSVAPLPSGAYKKAAPSTSFPAPSSATLLLPSPERNSRSATVFPLSGESTPLLPLPLRWSSKKLSEPSSSLTRPRTRNTTSQPQSLNQSPPAAIPAAELRHLPVDSPLPTPSGRIEPTLRIASLCPC